MPKESLQLASGSSNNTNRTIDRTMYLMAEILYKEEHCISKQLHNN